MAYVSLSFSIEDSEAAVKTKFPNSFKMVTHDSKDRTYYFAFDSPHVLQVHYVTQNHIVQ